MFGSWTLVARSCWNQPLEEITCKGYIVWSSNINQSLLSMYRNIKLSVTKLIITIFVCILSSVYQSVASPPFSVLYIDRIYFMCSDILKYWLEYLVFWCFGFSPIYVLFEVLSLFITWVRGSMVWIWWRQSG